MTGTPAQATVDRYKAAAIALLPPGEAFPKDWDGDVADVLEALSVEPARLHEDAAALLVNYDPARAVEMLPEWEQALGITPSGNSTIAERQGALITKLRGRTSHAKSLFEDAALSLGYGEETWMPLDLPLPKASLPQAPRALLSGRFRFVFACNVASGFSGTKELLSYGELGTQTGVYLNGFGGFCNLSVAPSGMNVAFSQNITFAAGQLITVDLDLANGTYGISGATTGNGTFPVFDNALSTRSQVAYTFTDGVLRLGYGPSGLSDSPFDGYIGDFAYPSRTGIEFRTYEPFVTGLGRAGDACYGDDWANVVRMYVPVDTQTADDALRDAFEYLRRSHGFLDIILEGPMGTERSNGSNYYFQAPMNADGVVADLASIPVRYGGLVAIQALIDNGSGGAPTDSVAGVFEIYFSTEGTRFTRATDAAIDAELLKIAALGNNAIVNRFAIFDRVPGRFMKLRWNNTGGGAGNSRMTVDITTW